MKSACAILFAALAAAVPAPAPQSGDTSGSAIRILRFEGRLDVPGGFLPHSTGTHVDANDLSFWFGKYTRTYSEDPVKQANTNTTIFRMIPGDDQLFLDTQADYGQAVYILPSGELKFRLFHPVMWEANYAIYKGFEFSDGYLRYEGQDFIACPQGDPELGNYSIWAASRTRIVTGYEACVDFKFEVEASAFPAAYSYY
ncbi:unnamed protein product [Zymoseptoria tritici ST99CH_1A5]|uniref:Uncharacterized protein n=1 Tax=Zymoseptoria tritici ST99CH_1A5 TaxID=1276529 RepID=A0A1Y6LV45_ZYMTR|nr:unnamed protein product [Zymoseptoria tritici ST99CH_1A5]